MKSCYTWEVTILKTNGLQEVIMSRCVRDHKDAVRELENFLQKNRDKNIVKTVFKSVPSQNGSEG